MAASAEATSQAAHEFYLKHAVGEFGDTHPLMVHVHAPGSLHLRDREVESLADLRGLKVRALTRMTTAALEALGATPIGMPGPHVPESRASGGIDGAALPRTEERRAGKKGVDRCRFRGSPKIIKKTKQKKKN